MIDKSVAKRLAIQCGLILKTTNLELCPSYLTKLEAFANAIIRAFVAEQKPVAWMYDNKYLLKAELTAPVYEIKKPLYDLKGE